MKTLSIISLFFLFIAKTLYGQADIKVARQIDSLEAEDLQNRTILRQADKLQFNSATRKSIENKIVLTDSLNFPPLRRIFQDHGYAGYDLVGKRTSHSFCLLVQHQDKHPAFQDSVSMKMKIEVDKKNASSSDYAYLVDKLKVNAKQLQVYGTQLQINKNATSYEVKPVIEPDKLNERRKSVGLSTIEEYINMMNNSYFDSSKKK